MTDLSTEINRLARPETLPDGSSLRVLDLRAEAKLTAAFGLSPREVQIAALQAGIAPRRYLRNFRQFSFDDQLRLLRSHVALVGLGGLGGWVLEGLARLGVGAVRAADPDGFEEHNLNRQMLATAATQGQSKAQAAAARVREVNPAVQAEIRAERADARGLAAFLEGADLALDCLGGGLDRPGLVRAAADAGVPLVTGGVAGSTGFVGTVTPGCMSPSELLCPDDPSGCGAEAALGCQMPAIYVVCGLMLAQAAQVLTGKTPTLAGKAAVIDLTDARTVEVLELPPRN